MYFIMCTITQYMIYTHIDKWIFDLQTLRALTKPNDEGAVIYY